MNEIIGLHKEKVISLSSADHGRCFMAAAFHGETKLLNLLKESFCNSSENNIGKKWLATTTAKVFYQINLGYRVLDNFYVFLGTNGSPCGCYTR